jgi:thiamine-monophosphate kinase
MLSEANIIEYLHAEFPTNIGDDAAVIPLSETSSYVLTKDVLIEDVHFRRVYYDPASLAHKALHVNLSDLAAMGAKPQFVLLGLSIPASYEKEIHEFLKGFSKACKDASVILIGGDTTQSPDKLFISITAIGVAETSKIKYRNRALPGDVICFAGVLGHAHLGLMALEAEVKGLQTFKKVCLKPIARLQEGAWLSHKKEVTAMMDLSDGLFIDLQRLCASSKVAANIQLEQLMPSEEFVNACQQLGLDPLQVQLTGGEDYGLLLTVAPEAYANLTTEFKRTLGYDLQSIGHIVPGEGVYFMQQGSPRELLLKPFSHFGE